MTIIIISIIYIIILFVYPDTVGYTILLIYVCVLTLDVFGKKITFKINKR